MQIRNMILGPVQTNVYLIINEETKEAVLFDPADSPGRILSYLDSEGLELVAICLTHGHYDHITGLPGLLKEKKVPVYGSRREERVFSDGEKNHSLINYGFSVTVSPDHLLDDGDEFELAGLSFRMIDTPGHTEGSCCYYIESEKVLISGDTLFEGSVGRTDLPTGSMKELMRSVNEKLAVLPDDTEVFPGHGGATTIGDEKRWNPYFRPGLYGSL